MGRTRARILCFPGVVHPEQFEHGIVKEKAAICRSLAGMHIGWPFSQTQIPQLLSFRGADFAANKQMVQLKSCHSDDFSSASFKAGNTSWTSSSSVVRFGKPVQSTMK